MTDFTICNNIFVNFNSHADGNDGDVFKGFGEWVEVKYLKQGMRIAVAGQDNNEAEFEEIRSIKLLEPQQVYDIEVEGTHNFIANSIVAHNTAIQGNVGIFTIVHTLHSFHSATIGTMDISMV